MMRFGLVAANAAVMGLVFFFVLSSAPADQTANASLVVDGRSALSSQAALSPVDAFTASDVAVSVAKVANLKDLEAAVTNQAESVRATMVLSANDNSIANKPQITETALKSWRDIKEYTVLSGDTVSGLASKFGITSDSIRWSNNINGENLTVGNVILIPPANGIVRTVAAGDTPQSLASKYHADSNRIAADNDAEAEALVVGRRVFIADGSILNRSAATRVTAVAKTFRPVYGYNGYDPGWCTYYAAEVSGAPAGWGNANTWAYFAARTPGWQVSSTPSVGAIFQTSAGRWGHVGIVEAVSEDRTMIKISDMNGIAGFWRVGYSDWVPASKYPNYISRI